MARNKSSKSKATTYQQMVEFWDSVDAMDVIGDGEDVEFDVRIERDITYYALDNEPR